MCSDMLIGGFNATQNAVWNMTQTATNCVETCSNYLQRTVENLTTCVLPPTAARVAQKMIYASPVTVTALILPTPVIGALIATYFVARTAFYLVNELPLSEKSYNNLFTGIGTAFLYSASHESVNMAMRVPGANLISIFIKIFCAGLCYSSLTTTPATPLPTAGASQASKT